MSEANQWVNQAWEELEKSIVTYRGEPVGTVAARDPGSDSLNYDQCFTRDFSVSAVAFLVRGRTDIVRNFLTTLVELQHRERHMDWARPAKGVMPASFAVLSEGSEEKLVPDFGDNAIGRVPPVDSGFWWIILLRAYTRATGDLSLAHQEEFQHALRLILELSLTPRFDTFPTVLVPDGSYMIDRRMGVAGYPFDIQVLLFASLSASLELLEEGSDLLPIVHDRLHNLTYSLQRYYWLNFQHLNEIYRYKVEEYGSDVINVFNIYPDSIPGWVMEWLPTDGGYFAGNVAPGQMDFRYFAQGNLLSILTSLATDEQAQTILNLIEARPEDLLGEVPVKLCYPALVDQDWRTLTGSDPKNTPWSYHNGGNWPFLLWIFAGACIKTGRESVARNVLDNIGAHLAAQNWPEYYDGPDGRFIGKEARTFQTWTIAGFAAAHDLLENPERIDLFSFHTSPEINKISEQVAEKIREGRA